MLEIKRENEIKKLPLLYILFCLLLKIDPLPAKEELKTLAPKIKQLNTDIQNCYKIEKRTILWQQEYDKIMEKEQERQKQEKLKQSKKKSRKYLR